MKKMYLYSVLVITALSCSKDDDNEYALEHSNQGIVGSWKLVEALVGNGAGKTSKVNMESKNYVITFKSEGDVISSDFSCEGEYEFDPSKPGELGDNNLSVTFKECEATRLEWYSIRGKADARISEFNTLILNSESCDEGCTRIYRRLK